MPSGVVTKLGVQRRQRLACRPAPRSPRASRSSSWSSGSPRRARSRAGGPSRCRSSRPRSRALRVRVEGEVEVVVLGEVEDPGRHVQQLPHRDRRPVEGGGQELRDGSSRSSRSCPASWSTTSAVIVLVTLPMRMWLSSCIGRPPAPRRAQRRPPGALARRVDEHERAGDLQLPHQRGDLWFERGGVGRWGLLRGGDRGRRRRGAGGEGETEQRQSDAEAGAEHAVALRAGHGCLTVKVGGVRFATSSRPTPAPGAVDTAHRAVAGPRGVRGRRSPPSRVSRSAVADTRSGSWTWT